jgi:hypothetical protein
MGGANNTMMINQMSQKKFAITPLFLRSPKTKAMSRVVVYLGS